MTILWSVDLRRHLHASLSPDHVGLWEGLRLATEMIVKTENNNDDGDGDGDSDDNRDGETSSDDTINM